ncbi:SAM-dependent methyltransferase [Saccharothrix tamanrassetensis]|uniref:SAM-dependent methyltransferase n=1 Tax=Saccharothrix tamanrassetensis TaxID=1051531 RepID=A0A841C9U4_9PSEU|nr:class I SAM-dependent methyltransferase [Saccharothrix tamanrassetensis]MBB5954179.1 SAM-dependent methyltransferase [Saccharothrix tamanrassetensis]
MDTPSEPVEALKDLGWREITAIDDALRTGAIDERGWHEAMAGLLRPAYLTAPTPWGQSGVEGSEQRWIDGRKFVVDALDRDGTFLDCGCANGYLMECLHRWAADKGLAVEPHGVDIVPEFVALARSRLPHWADRIHLGNVLSWTPPFRFDAVRVGLEYVPAHRRASLVARLLDEFVAPGGRLVIGPFTEEVGERSTENELASWGHPVTGRSEVAHRDHRVIRRLVWTDR